MLKTVQTYMHEHNMISAGDRVVVGVSGGADSVCLFHVLLKIAPSYKLTLFVVHVNHGIRGEEADGDEAYVKEICNKNGVTFIAVKANVPKIASLEGLSEEEAGRKVRYEAFYDCCKKHECNKIAIAHNRNDNAETILFHLFRGSGIKGLTGIRATRENIIRPLLCISRIEIENYLEQNQISYRTDSTNLTLDYSRNKIRHHIIRFAQEEINSKVIEHIVNAAHQLKEIDQYLEKNVKTSYEKVVIIKGNQVAYQIGIESLKQEDVVIQKGIIRMVFQQLAHQLKDVDALHVDLVLALAEKEVGKFLNLPYGILAVKGYQEITMSVSKIQQKDISESCNELKHMIRVPEDYYIPQINQTLHTKLFNYKKNMIIPQNGCTKWFDYDKIKNTVLIRTRNEGDFIQIDSKGSRKKLKSLFIDDKIPREKRDLLPLLADGEHIMWVIGGRISEAYKVSEETKVILEISIDGGYKMEDKIKVLIAEEQVDKRIRELGEQISNDYANKEIHLICVLKGGVFVTCELAKRITVPLSLDFMSVTSYGDETVSSGMVKIVKDLDNPIEGKDVLIVEDIIDSGNTLRYLVDLLYTRKPNSIKICTLLDKPERRVTDVAVDYVGFQIPDKFVVGYGLDYVQKYRNLPYIGVID